MARTILAAFVFALAGCAAGGGHAPAERAERAPAPTVEAAPTLLAVPAVVEAPSAALNVWIHDPGLEAPARAAAARIRAAAGVTVHVNADDTLFDALPVFLSSAGVGEWSGLYHEGAGDADWIAIASDLPADAFELVLLHEMLHALGAAHVEQGEGVLSPHLAPDLQVSSADLNSLCAVRECTAYATETPVITFRLPSAPSPTTPSED